jgi:hypothetical protein
MHRIITLLGHNLEIKKATGLTNYALFIQNSCKYNSTYENKLI